MTVCFIGLGYIGLPTAIISAKNGLTVFGCDLNAHIVEATNAGKLHFKEPGLEAMLRDVVVKSELLLLGENSLTLPSITRYTLL